MRELKTRCPRCNEIARHSAGEGGLPALCHACGAQFIYPPVTGDSATVTLAPATAWRPKANRRLAVPWIIAGLAVVVIAAGMALMWALTIHSAVVAKRAVAQQILQEANDLYMQHR